MNASRRPHSTVYRIREPQGPELVGTDCNDEVFKSAVQSADVSEKTAAPEIEFAA